MKIVNLGGKGTLLDQFLAEIRGLRDELAASPEPQKALARRQENIDYALDWQEKLFQVASDLSGQLIPLG